MNVSGITAVSYTHLEPLESKEVYRIEDFAIVIDTSMSCSGELVARFLEETYDVLSESGSYFKKVHVPVSYTHLVRHVAGAVNGFRIILVQGILDK